MSEHDKAVRSAVPHWLIAVSGLLCLFTLIEVNRPTLRPESQLALFAALALLLCFEKFGWYPRAKARTWLRYGDRILAFSAFACCIYVVVQTEPLFEEFWIDGAALGDRAGTETGIDIAVGVVGLLLVMEATRRSIGWILPLLASCFLAYAYFGAALPDWLFPHRGYSVERIVAQTFLHSQGVFGTALRVMFFYVFLFVLFGAVLRQTGATSFIVDLAQRTFRNSVGGPAKVAVLSSGLMGSLSGSAVANTATTGTFTIPLMRSSGFSREVAAGIEAAASSGGALVPPVMGAGAYMMLEIIDPPVTFLQIVKAAIFPSILYYWSLLLIVHFYSKRVGARPAEPAEPEAAATVWVRGAVFVLAFSVLLASLFVGYTVFKAATFALIAALVGSSLHRATRISLRGVLQTLTSSARDAIPLVSAAACVGIVIGVVTLTGIGTKLPETILGVSQDHLLPALALIMISSIILGMGLPSAVCYLLLATLIGPVLGKLGVVPLSAHLFIFYFGMMSMVTPPVALAAYAASSIAGSKVTPTAFAAFRFAFVGFALPYLFVLRPELLMLDATGGPASFSAIFLAVVGSAIGIVAFAAGTAGYLVGALGTWGRIAALASAVLLLLPAPRSWAMAGTAPALAVSGLVILAVLAWRGRAASCSESM